MATPIHRTIARLSVPARRGTLGAAAPGALHARSHPAGVAVAREALAGLARRPRALPSHLFYDELGSRLFQWITNLPDYYLARVEREILERRGAAAAAPFAGGPVTVVDLGAGDGHKTRIVVDHLRRVDARVTYAPVDVSAAALQAAAARMQIGGGEIRVAPIEGRYGAGIRRAAALDPGARRLVLFLGSSVGNLEHAGARAFFRTLRGALAPGDHALVGFDLVKPLDVLSRAYDDPQGVTRAFNLNLLVRLNRECGADFDLRAFRHVATHDPVRPAMESWLESVRRQVVHVAGRRFVFEAGERIHTEISCKYTLEMVSAFARGAGFTERAVLTDRRVWFADVLWSVGGGR